MKKSRILLIDDNPDFLEIFGAKFKLAGFEVASELGYTPDTLSKIAAHDPNLVILEYVMHNSMGIELMKALRAKKRTKKYKVVILSTHREKEFIEEAIKEGAIDWILKTGDLDEMVGRIRQIIEDPKGYKLMYPDVLAQGISVKMWNGKY